MIFLAFNTEFRSSIHIGPYYNNSTLCVLIWVGPKYALIKILLLYTFLNIGLSFKSTTSKSTFTKATLPWLKTKQENI